ncbi:hypothetical protein BGW39_010625 [Mortierella sp. 14UC]|nr:hypothetical protein BGW39_010625 [Mortierella sp. 14UC]
MQSNLTSTFTLHRYYFFPSDTLKTLLLQSKQDRPEVRAKTSIGIVAFAVAKAAGVDNVKDDDLEHLDAWIAIAHGLGDEWPLVREAFQEQLTTGFEKSDALRIQISQDELFDRIVSRAQEAIEQASERLATATGILELIRLTQGDSEKGLLCQSWNNGRVDAILTMAIKGWATQQKTPQAARFIEHVARSFSDSQLVRSLGSMTTTSLVQSAQMTPFVRFATTVLRSLTLNTTTATASTHTASTATAALQVQDWALAIWVCEKLRIPKVFATRSHLEDSPDNVRIATSFAESAPILMECLAQILRIQTVDNTYTLHRIIMACAAFTNPKDTWNQRHPSISKATTLQAEQNLTAIIQHTHWSIKNSRSTTTPSSGALLDDDNDSNSNSHDRHRNAIMIPGSFSDHVIQILEKEIRPCFANIQAQKVAQRAQATIEMHQDKLKQQQLIAAGEEGGSKEVGTINNAGGSTGKDVARREQHTNKPVARFKIAPVGDAPNDEDEFWTRMDNRAEEGDPTLPKRWDVDFLESVPIAEWCARQPIKDSSRILEVFMVLVGPILAMAESVNFRYRVRGLDLLSRFLLRYHDNDSSAGAGKGGARAAMESRRIWIRIFERTGLDQVLERTLTPLLTPIQAMFSPAPGAEDYHPGSDESGYSLEVLNAAFGAYLTLILVNSEPADKPTSAADDSTRVPLSHQSSISSSALTVENLFLHGILGSFKRASPSKEYRTVILEWLARLVRPVVSLDFLVQQDKNESFLAHNEFNGIFGMGFLTIKYLPTLIPYLCGVLEVPLPSSPPDVRLESLTLAWRTSEALYHVMDVSRARIPRHRGQLLAAICKCWANSRIFSLDSASSSSTSVDGSFTTRLEQEQMRLDASLVRTMRLCIEICQPKITTANAEESVASGLDKDIKILQELDPAVFSPLFIS